MLYAEAFARKIQLNPTFDLVREATRAPYTDPLVTVAIRSDGSIESISFVRRSGVPQLDDAIERVVRSLERYPAFLPALARLRRGRDPAQLALRHGDTPLLAWSSAWLTTDPPSPQPFGRCPSSTSA